MMAENHRKPNSQCDDVSVKVEEEMMAETEGELLSQFDDIKVKIDEEMLAENQGELLSQFDDVKVKIDEEMLAENQGEPHSQFDGVSVKNEGKIKTEVFSLTSSQSQELCHVDKSDVSFEVNSDESIPSIGTGSQINMAVVDSDQVVLDSSNVNIDNPQWCSVRTQVLEVMEKAGYANYATESTVIQIVENVINETLESEEQLAAILGIQSSTQVTENNGVGHWETSSEDGSDGDFCVEIDVDESTQHSVIMQASAKEMEDSCCTSENIFTYQKTFNKPRGPIEDIDLKDRNISPKSEMSFVKSNTGTCIQRKKDQVLTCEKSFECLTSQKSDLIKHVRTHTGQKPFKCLTCGKSFSQKSDLKNHVRIHTGEKPFKCLTCEKSFSRNSCLTNHVRIHTHEKPFKCPTCEKSFPRQSSLKNHVMIHTGEKPFKCLTCGMSFSLNSKLKRHVKIHTQNSYW